MTTKQALAILGLAMVVAAPLVPTQASATLVQRTVLVEETGWIN